MCSSDIRPISLRGPGLVGGGGRPGRLDCHEQATRSDPIAKVPHPSSSSASLTSSPALSRASLAIADSQPAGGGRYPRVPESSRARRIVWGAMSTSVAMSARVIHAPVARPDASRKSTVNNPVACGGMVNYHANTQGKNKRPPASPQRFTDGPHITRPEGRALYGALWRPEGQGMGGRYV